MVSARRVALSLVLVVACGAPRDAQRGTAIPSAAGRYACPMRLLRDIPFVQVRVDDGAPEWFVLDTGAPITVFSSRLEGRLKRRPTDTAFHMIGAPDETRSVIYAFDDVRIGTAPLREVAGILSDLDAMQDRIGIPLGGILGFPAFEGVLLTLDYPNKQVVLEQGALDANAADVLTMTMHNLHPAVQAQLEKATCVAEIDSGSAFFLQTSADTFGALPFASPPRITSRIATLTGDSVARSARVKGTVHVGGYAIDDPIVITEQPADETLDSNDVVRVGGPFLTSFAITFDQRSGRVRLARSTHDPINVPSATTLGLSFVHGSGGWEVAGFIPDVPSNGVRVGDRVVSVDGAPAGTLDASTFAPGPPGRARRFVFSRGAAQIDVTVPVIVLVP
jgi:Aspartyl protease